MRPLPFIFGKETEFASELPTMTADVKVLLHTCTVFCTVTAERINNGTELENFMNHPPGWF